MPSLHSLNGRFFRTGPTATQVEESQSVSRRWYPSSAAVSGYSSRRDAAIAEMLARRIEIARKDYEIRCVPPGSRFKIPTIDQHRKRTVLDVHPWPMTARNGDLLDVVPTVKFNGHQRSHSLSDRQMTVSTWVRMEGMAGGNAIPRMNPRKLRRADKSHCCGQDAGGDRADPEMSAATLYNWRRQYCGMDTDAEKELKELREQDSGLKRLLAEAEDKDALREMARGNSEPSCQAPRRRHARHHDEHVETSDLQSCWACSLHLCTNTDRRNTRRP